MLVDGKSSEPHGLFLLDEGEVEIFRKNQNGHKTVLARREAPDFFGEIGALTGTPGSASVTTIGPCRIAELPGDEFVDLCRRHPDVSLSVLRRIAGNVRQLDAEVQRLNLAESLLERLVSRTGFLI